LFYLHGKIIEDQGIPAISPIYGKYEYLAILERLSSYGYKVISEPRPINADVEEYARITVRQVSALLEAGVPVNNITVVGASKGAYIVMLVSHILANESANFVLLAICHPEVVTNFIQDQNALSGNILSIYDLSDEYAGSCQELFSFSEGRGITRSEEIILDIGTGHGLLYSPLDEWVFPTVQWANKQAD
jgi:hypothetical protein